MASCLHCNKKFHTCCSCGIRGHEWDYCTDKCWQDAGAPRYCIDCEGKTEELDEHKMCKECAEEEARRKS